MSRDENERNREMPDADQQSQDKLHSDDEKVLDEFDVPDGLVESVVSFLDLSNDRRDETMGVLTYAAQEYLSGKLEREIVGSPKAQKANIRALIGVLDKTRFLITKISPAYQVALNDLAVQQKNSEPDMADFDIIQFENNLARLANAADQFLENFIPRKGAHGNNALENAMRVALPAIEQATGIEAKISWNKNKDIGAEPSAISAEAIVRLFQGLEPKMPTFTILNMIAKVKSVDEPNPDDLDAIMRAHVDETDLSLCGNN